MCKYGIDIFFCPSAIILTFHNKNNTFQRFLCSDKILFHFEENNSLLEGNWWYSEMKGKTKYFPCLSFLILSYRIAMIKNPKSRRQRESNKRFVRSSWHSVKEVNMEIYHWLAVARLFLELRIFADLRLISAHQRVLML